MSLLITGCTAADDSTTTPTADTDDPAVAQPTDPTDPSTSQTSAWLNQPVPFYAYFNDVTATFRIEPQDATDAYVGLANGRVDDAKQLGPALHLASDGTLQAVDGTTYRSDARIQYREGVQIDLKIDLEHHRYSARANGVAFATDYAFAASQANLSRIDTFAGGAAVKVTGIELGPKWCSVAGQSWIHRGHPAQSGQFHIQFEAQVSDDGSDAVVGLSGGEVSDMNALAGAVRFAPSGRVEARDGTTFRADNEAPFATDTFYTVSIDVDVPAGIYSVRTEGSPVATDYPLTGDPAELTGLGAFSSSGYVRICDLAVWNY